MRKELKVAAKNTHWWHFGLRALYFCDENGIENSLEDTIYRESLLFTYYVRNIVIEELAESGEEWLLNRSPEYIMDKYSTEYPELCLILFHLSLFGPLSPIGLSCDLVLGSCVNRIFGTHYESPLHNVDFYSKGIPIIRITDSVFTLGTNQPQFSTIDDVKNYYRDEARIEEIAKMCMFWIRKFYS